MLQFLMHIVRGWILLARSILCISLWGNMVLLLHPPALFSALVLVWVLALVFLYTYFITAKSARKVQQKIQSLSTTELMDFLTQLQKEE